MIKTLSLLAVSLAAALAPAHAATISLNVIPPLQAGSPFDVQVQVTDVFDGRLPGDTLVGYGFNVTIGDGTVLSYVGEDPGALFDDASAFFGGNPMVAGFATNPAGIGPSDFIEPLILAILHFQALSPGSSSIGVTWDNTDLNQGLIFANLPFGALSASTTASVTAATAATPEPSTALLLILGSTCFSLSKYKLFRLQRRSRNSHQ
jgi:hypothetical protein